MFKHCTDSSRKTVSVRAERHPRPRLPRWRTSATGTDRKKVRRRPDPAPLYESRKARAFGPLHRPQGQAVPSGWPPQHSECTVLQVVAAAPSPSPHQPFSAAPYSAPNSGPYATFLDASTCFPHYFTHLPYFIGRYDFNESTHQIVPSRFYQRGTNYLLPQLSNSKVRKQVRCALLPHSINMSAASNIFQGTVQEPQPS